MQPLKRRTFLRGMGVGMALPLLEAMLPKSFVAAEAAMSSNALNRMAFVFFPNGAILPDWNPKQEGTDFELPNTLKPLESVRRKLLVLSGLAQDNARAKGDGPGDHARSSAAFLTGAHPAKTSGADIKVGISVDQLAAEKLAKLTRLPSLELGTERSRTAGQCDSGYSCAYSSSISWKTATTPMAKEINPKFVFERLFGNGADEAKSRQKRDQYRQSILDLVRDDAADLQKKLGTTDRRKVEEYFTSVRDIEQRMARSNAEAESRKIPEMKLPDDVPRELSEHIDLMYDLMTVAFQTDSTRVITFMLANEGSNRSYPMVKVNDGHHHLSHHQGKQEWIDQLKKIDLYLVERFARFLQKMDSITEGNGTLLDHSMILYGSAISDGNAHWHHDLPILLAGGGSGALKPGRHIKYPKDTPLNNLFLTMLDTVKAGPERFGDSTARLKGLDS